MSDSEGPPPLVDSSSDEAEGECKRYGSDPLFLSSSDISMPVPSNDDRTRSESRPPAPPVRPPSPDLAPGTLREAAEFCLAGMKQTLNGLQVWE